MLNRVWWALVNFVWRVYLVTLAVCCLAGMILVYRQHTDYSHFWALIVGEISGVVVFAWAAMLSTNLVAAVGNSLSWLWRMVVRDEPLLPLAVSGDSLS